MSEHEAVKTPKEVLEEVGAFLGSNEKQWNHEPLEKFEDCVTKLKSVIQGDASEEEKRRAKDLFGVAQRCLFTALIESKAKSSLSSESRWTMSKALQEGLKQLRIGSMLDNSQLKVLGTIETEKYGVVCKGLYHEMLVAVKVLRPEYATTHEIDLFISEVQRMARLRHPHLCDYIGYIPEPFQIVTRIYDRTLFSVLTEWKHTRQQVFTREKKFRMVCQLGSVLQYLHQTGVPYCDLKPENIYLDSNGDIKLGCFGLIKDVLEIVRDSRTPVGKLLFMAPEVLQQSKLDLQGDVYSFALIVYEVFTGRCVFPGVCAREKLVEAQRTMKLLRVTSDDWSNEFQDILPPKEFWDLVQRCWSYDAKERPTMDQVVPEITRIGVCAAIPMSDEAVQFWLKCSNNMYKERLLVQDLHRNMCLPTESYFHDFLQRLTPSDWTRFTLKEFTYLNCWFPNFFADPNVLTAMIRLSYQPWFARTEKEVNDCLAEASGNVFLIRPSTTEPMYNPFTLVTLIEGDRKNTYIRRLVNGENRPAFFCSLTGNKPFWSLNELAECVVKEMKEFSLKPPSKNHQADPKI